MTGFLNDLGLSTAPKDPNFLPEGTYPAFISKLSIKGTRTKDREGKALIITYKIAEIDKENQGKHKTEFKPLPLVKLDSKGKPVKNPDGSLAYESEESKKNASYLKLRLMSLGVPESELDSMSQENLLGTPVWIDIKQVGEYYNIVGVKLREEVPPEGSL